MYGNDVDNQNTYSDGTEPNDHISLPFPEYHKIDNTAGFWNYTAFMYSTTVFSYPARLVIADVTA